LQYVRDDFWALNKEEREEKGNKYRVFNTKIDEWTVESYENRKFLCKWNSYRWELSGERYHKRLLAYTNRYNMGKNCIIHHDVVLERQHGLDGRIIIGNNVLLAKHVYIDYSGEVCISDNVKISAEVTIESHRHEFIPGSKESRAIPTKILIEEGVWIGQKVIVCEEVKKIGRFAQIGAGSVVRNAVPPYSLVAGNPAKIVGFLYTPEEVDEFERDKYQDDEKTNIEIYRKQYDKYFINRISEIKKLLNN
jgi:acetyltransferase-like isoleucine patch superfamily enzyme